MCCGGAVDDLVSESPTTSYEVPRVTSLDGPGASEASTYGGETVFIHGANFGPPGPSVNTTSYFEQVRRTCPWPELSQSLCSLVCSVRLSVLVWSSCTSVTMMLVRILQATYGRYRAAGCVVVDHDLITCKTEPGIGAALPWLVTVGGQQSTDVVTSAYGAPQIMSAGNVSALLTSGNIVVRCCVCVMRNHGCVVVLVVLTRASS